LITLPQAAAEKQRRKDEKRAVAAGSDSNDPEKSPIPEDLDVDEKDGQGFDGIMSLRAAAIPKNKDNSIAVKERIPAVPVFPGPSTLRDVVKKADVVLHVVDARDPIGGMSDALSEAAQGKLTVLLNKAGVYDRSAGVQTHMVLQTPCRENRSYSGSHTYGHHIRYCHSECHLLSCPPGHRLNRRTKMPSQCPRTILWALLVFGHV
jgi:hypothetical protein